MPAAVQERAASWTRIHTKQPRLLGDISKEAPKALGNDAHPAFSGNSASSPFCTHTIHNQIRFRNDDKLDQFRSVSPLKTVPNPKGSNVAMTSLHINVIKGALEGEIPTNSDFDMTIFKKKSLPQGPFLGYCFHFTCALLLGMKW